MAMTTAADPSRSPDTSSTSNPDDTHLAAAVYVGDDATDLDAFRGLTELQELGKLDYALRVGVRSDEGPATLQEEADTMVDGTDGVRVLLTALLH